MSIIIEYLDQHYPGRARLIPGDPELARRCGFRDRFFDLYVHLPMQKIVTDRLRPEGRRTRTASRRRRGQLQTALGMVDKDMAATKTWATGDTFSWPTARPRRRSTTPTSAPFSDTHRVRAPISAGLIQRPSFARVLKEAEPYFKFFPKNEAA